jgi:hypothetical protein
MASGIQSCVDPATDAKNCGYCGHDCLGGACSGGLCSPTTLVSGAGSSISAYLLDGSNIYATGMTSPSVPVVFRTTNQGGSLKVLSSDSKLMGPRYLAADSNSLYVAAGGAGNNLFQVIQLAKIGFPAIVLGKSSTEAPAPSGLCLSGSNVFLTTSDSLYNKSGIWLLHPNTTSTVTSLFSTTPSGVFRGAACSSELLYVLQSGSVNTISSELPAGGAPTDLVLGQKNVVEFTTNDTSFVWTVHNITGGGIFLANLDGSKTQQLLATLSGAPSSVVADTKGIYWSDSKANTINYLSLDGSVQHTLGVSSDGNVPTSLQLDSGYVYYLTRANYTDAMISRVPR